MKIIKNIALIAIGVAIGVFTGKEINKKEHPKAKISAMDVPELQKKLSELNSKIEDYKL